MTDTGKARRSSGGGPAPPKAMGIGKTPSGAIFRVPAEFVTLTMGVVGIRGSGKTTAAKVFVEEMLARGFQVVIIDPVNVWWGLRSSADGKGDGFPVVILGDPAEQQQADLPLEPNAGKVLADFVVDRGASVVLSLGHMSKTNQKQFVAEFGERLYRQKGKARHRTPLHLVIDEADSFAPQRVMANVARCFGAVDDLVRRGRAKGIGVTLISQRPATLNKDVLTQVETLLMLRMLSPQDRKAVEAWIEVHDVAGVGDRVMESLPKLKCGQAWVWSPAWLELLERVNIRAPKTFDSSATPKVGQTARAPRKMAKVDLDALSKEIQATVERAKASDPAALKRRNAQLERDLRKVQQARPAAAEPETVVKIKEVPMLTAADRKLLESALKEMGPACVKAVDAAETLKAMFGRMDRVISASLKGLDEKLRAITVPAPAASRPAGPRRIESQAPPARAATRPPIGDSPGTVGDEKLSKCERAILTVLAADSPSMATRIAICAGYSYKSSSFRNALSGLRSKNYIRGGNKESIAICEEGIHAVGPVEPLPTGRALFDYWCGRVKKAPREILIVLDEIWPEGMTPEAVGASTASGYSPTSSSFRNALSKLRTLKLIEGSGEVRLRDDFAEAAR